MKKPAHTKTTLKAKIKSAISTWWDGKYIPEPPGSMLFTPYFHKHWTAELAHWLVGFFRREWRWILMFTIAITGLLFKLS